jgi:hypothetical protein
MEDGAARVKRVAGKVKLLVYFLKATIRTNQWEQQYLQGGRDGMIEMCKRADKSKTKIQAGRD